ncbi:MAG TPA: response regulator [Gemmataceae bacterium]|nr:response regulator [Gemmataceae bacterium]
MHAPTEKPRVLVVDDNYDAATTLRTLLETAGYEVQTCFDARSALKVADRFDPDACVLDINMPGMNGYELARRLREKDPIRPPVLVTVTAYDGYTHLSKAADAGFDLHFTKPADPAEVLDQLGDSVRKQAIERQSACSADQLADGVLAEIDAEEAENARPRAAGLWVAVAGIGVLMVGLLAFAIRQAI